MKLDIYDVNTKKVGSVELNISGVIRDDIFKKVVLSERSWFRQPYGSSPLAGKKYAISLSKRRRKFRTTYGRGISRIPKKVMWRRGTQLRFVGAFAPGTVGGRKAHPPKSYKNFIKNINNKEWLLGLKTGLLASLNKDIIIKNGQRVPKTYPIVLDESFNQITKTKDFKKVLEDLGFKDEIERVSKVKIRAGRGKMRNRKYKTKRGPLIVVDNEENIVKVSRNLKGFDIIPVDLLLVKDFGMDVNPGRTVLFTKSAIEKIKEELL